MDSLEIKLSELQLDDLAARIAERVKLAAPTQANRVSVSKAAEAFGVSESSLRRSIKAGMPVLRFGSRIVVEIDRASAWLSSNGGKLCDQ